MLKAHAAAGGVSPGVSGLLQVPSYEFGHFKHRDLGLFEYGLQLGVGLNVALVGRVLKLVLSNVSP